MKKIVEMGAVVIGGCCGTTPDHIKAMADACRMIPIKPVEKMIEAMGDGTSIPEELIPRYPVCGEEAFPWVRGYGNFLQGRKYDEQYQKISKYIMNNKEKKILFLELGVGRMTPMFIQEPFWNLTLNLPDAYYIAVNAQYDFLPKDIEEKGMVMKGDIAKVLKDAAERV